MTDDFALPASKPLWLMTLADLALLLVGFLVLVQATSLDTAALAKGLRAGFDIDRQPPAMPVAAAALTDFSPGSAALPSAPDDILSWARDVAGDPRVRLRVAGSVDGSARDVDPATGSGALLAADRARAVADALLQARAVAPDRLTIVNGTSTGQRRVLVSLAFAGDPE